MNLATNYLGLHLQNPFVVGASPMVDNLDICRQLEDAGAAAIVMHSLFEEQIAAEEQVQTYHVESHEENFAEATSYFPEPLDYALGPDQYLRQVGRLKESLNIPVIGSLNGVTEGGWVEYARLIEEAGADALELNFYFLATDPAQTAVGIEERAIAILKAVKQNVTVPVAVKLSPFFSALPNFATHLVEAGANGLVLFNRFYQPDIDIEDLEVTPSLHLSDSGELLLRLRWLAICSAVVETNFAASGGVHTAQDAIKALMAGATVVQMVSALLKNGPSHLYAVQEVMLNWLEEHEYESLDQLRGSMSLKNSPDPLAFERGNYLKILQGWKV